MKRIFAAIRIKPGENFLSHYYYLRQELKNEKINWVSPENMHLTLKFFGETPEEQIDDICEVMKAVADKYSSFSVSINKTGIFGSSYNPRVIWLRFVRNEMLIKLAEELLVKLDENGFERDRQNFVPHLTLARIKEIQNKKHFQAVIDKVKNNTIQEETIGKLSLYESILKPSGAVYVELKSFILGIENK